MSRTHVTFDEQCCRQTRPASHTAVM